MHSIAIIGAGGVGTAFIEQLKRYKSTKPFQVVLIARTSLVAYNKDGLSLQSSISWKEEAWNIEMIQSFLKSVAGPVVVIDNTSSEAIAEEYPQLISNGFSIITPNKKAFSSSAELYNSIYSQLPSGASVYKESTVGAGLPVICTLQDLLVTGDKIIGIKGVFSGTLSFIFNNFSASKTSFSEVVRKAKDLGYTEPDPADDLNGMDVARKLLILARECGVSINEAGSTRLPNMQDIPVNSLVPEEMKSYSSADEFITNIQAFDSKMDDLKALAEKENRVLRYVAKMEINNNIPSFNVGIEQLPLSDPFAQLQGSDNIFVFTTMRYNEVPLIIRGPGAGADVTAMGILADLNRLLSRSK